jgi:hypothetical protein
LGAKRTILHYGAAVIRCANRSGRPISVGANRLFRTPRQTGRRPAGSMQQCLCWYPGNHIGFLIDPTVTEFVRESLTSASLADLAPPDDGSKASCPSPPGGA